MRCLGPGQTVQHRHSEFNSPNGADEPTKPTQVVIRCTFECSGHESCECRKRGVRRLDLPLLAPSILRMPRAPKVEGAERDRITVLLGAGASTFAHAPTTSQLTTTLEGHPITAAILGRLRKNDETKDANFEDALYLLEELEHLCEGEERSALMLRGFADASAFLQAHNLQHTDLRLARFSIYEHIADAFNGIDYDAVWPELANFLDPFLEHFELESLRSITTSSPMSRSMHWFRRPESNTLTDSGARLLLMGRKHLVLNSSHFGRPHFI